MPHLLTAVRSALHLRIFSECKTTFSTARRGTRVACNIPVTLTTLNAISWFSEPGVVILANLQGCAVRSHAPVEIGMSLLMDGLPAAKMVSARVVNCTPAGDKLWVMGLALEKLGNIWGIEDPPEDWGKCTQEN